MWKNNGNANQRIIQAAGREIKTIRGKEALKSVGLVVVKGKKRVGMCYTSEQIVSRFHCGGGGAMKEGMRHEVAVVEQLMNGAKKGKRNK